MDPAAILSVVGEEDGRFFKWVWAISMRTGPLKRAIDRYKVEERRAWAAIFGRVLLGYLNAHGSVFQRYDLIIPSPTWIGDGGRAFDHTGLVIQQAIIEDDVRSRVPCATLAL